MLCACGISYISPCCRSIFDVIKTRVVVAMALRLLTKQALQILRGFLLLHPMHYFPSCSHCCFGLRLSLPMLLFPP